MTDIMICGLITVNIVLMVLIFISVCQDLMQHLGNEVLRKEYAWAAGTLLIFIVAGVVGLVLLCLL